MSFLTAKIPQALADRIGASAADFSEKLSALLDGQDAKLAAAMAAPKPAEIDASLVSRLSAVETKLAELSAAPVVDKAALLQECREAAAAETAAKMAAVLAKTAGAPLASGEPPKTNSAGRTFETAMSEQLAAGKSKAEAIRSVIQSEPALYAAWKQGDSSKI